MIMGLFYTMEGIGSLLGTTLLHLVSPFWLNNMTDYGNINDNHLDFYLYFLGVLQFTTFLVYCGSLYMQRFSLRPIAMPRSRRRGRRNRSDAQMAGRGRGAGIFAEEEEEEDDDEDEEEEEDENEDEHQDEEARREERRPSDTQQLLREHCN